MAVFVVVTKPASLGLALLVETRKYEPLSMTNEKSVLPHLVCFFVWNELVFYQNVTLLERLFSWMNFEINVATLGNLMDDTNHTSQVGTQLYMSPEQVFMYFEDILLP